MTTPHPRPARPLTVAVTGGAGFIGGYVVDELNRRGHRPVIFDPYARAGTAPNAGQRIGDVRDRTAVHELAAHVDGIIHLAACLGTQETIDNPLPACETNLLGAINVFDAAAQYRIPVTYIAVGNRGMYATYSITKSAAEDLAIMYNRYRGTRINIVRLMNAVGPGQAMSPPFGPAKVRKIAPAFIGRALTGQPIEVYGDGEQVSDCLHVRDGARALVAALEAADVGDVFDRVVEVGPAEHHTVNQVARLVINTVGVDVGIKYLPMRPGETPGAQVVADVSTLSLVGMDHRELVPLGETIAETVEYFRKSWLPNYIQRLGPGSR